MHVLLPNGDLYIYQYLLQVLDAVFVNLLKRESTLSEVLYITLLYL